MSKDELEELQAEQRYDAVCDFERYLYQTISSLIKERGGNGEEFQSILFHRDVACEFFDALFHCLPADYGVKTYES